MTFPSFIPETIVIRTVSVEADMEPVFIRRVPFLLLHILECPEATSNMIEYSVQHDLYIVIMQIFTDFFKVFVRSKTTVDLAEISCVIPMVV